jgi:uncharacterized membrane protein HdeD (DUF308 family)
MGTDLTAGTAEGLRNHRTWFLALGIVLILLGIAALTFNILATIVSVLFFGWLFLIGGVVELFHAFRIHRWGGTLLHMLSRLLAIIAGLVFVVYPVAGALSLTLMLGALFLVEGIFTIFGAARFGLSGWGVQILRG